jgi:hypothetical protein
MRRTLADIILRPLSAVAERYLSRTPSQRIQDAARSHARQDVGDESARSSLQADLDDVPRAALEAEIAAWWPRATYIDDRAYRLLVGVRDGRAPAMDPARREQLEQDAALGRLPLPEAFARLAAADPELRELESQAIAGHKPSVKDARRVFGKSPTPDKTAVGVAWLYLGQCARGKVDSRAYFEQATSSGTHGTVHVRPHD